MNKQLQAAAGPDRGCYGDYNAAPVISHQIKQWLFHPILQMSLCLKRLNSQKIMIIKKLCVPASEDTGTLSFSVMALSCIASWWTLLGMRELSWMRYNILCNFWWCNGCTLAISNHCIYIWSIFIKVQSPKTIPRREPISTLVVPKPGRDVGVFAWLLPLRKATEPREITAIRGQRSVDLIRNDV